MNNQDIVAVRVGDNVEEIAESAFGNCPSLKYIISGKNVKKALVRAWRDKE